MIQWQKLCSLRQVVPSPNTDPIPAAAAAAGCGSNPYVDHFGDHRREPPRYSGSRSWECKFWPLGNIFSCCRHNARRLVVAGFYSHRSWKIMKDANNNHAAATTTLLICSTLQQSHIDASQVSNNCTHSTTRLHGDSRGTISRVWWCWKSKKFEIN